VNVLASHDKNGLLKRALVLGRWQSDSAAIFEALPHMASDLNADVTMQTLENLSVPFDYVRCRLKDLVESDVPTLVFPDHGRPFIFLRSTDQGLEVQFEASEEAVFVPPTRASAIAIVIRTYAEAESHAASMTVSEAFASFRPMLPGLFTASLFVNVLGLATPILIMAIYDRVIPTGSTKLLVSLTLGVAIIFGFEFLFRQTRTRALAYVGRKSERALSLALFRKLMSLPLGEVSKSNVDEQLARFRSFEALREPFTGQLMTTLLDLPFALLFLTVLFLLAPPVGFVVLIVIAAFGLTALVTTPIQQRLNLATAGAVAQTRRQYFDAITHQRAMYQLGIGSRWIERCDQLVSTSEAAVRKARQLQSGLHSFAQGLTSVATVGAIVLSAQGALNGSLSFGALIAVIVLVGKTLSPIQSLFTSLPQLLSFFQSRTQADRLFRLGEEVELGVGQSHQSSLKGDIAFHGVTHRPDAKSAPVLTQVSFHCPPGALTVVMASDESARTAILDLIDGLVQPIAGTIEHDQIDSRQIARDFLRRSIGYAPQQKAFFHGTILQNFRMNDPSITEDAVWEALFDLGLEQDILDLPDGIETRLKGHDRTRWPDETWRGLVLARTIARPRAILLFSEPTDALSAERRAQFRNWLSSHKGRHTIVIATADRALIPLADRCLYLDSGRLTVNGEGESGRKKLLAMLKKHG